MLKKYYFCLILILIFIFYLFFNYKFPSVSLGKITIKVQSMRSPTKATPITKSWIRLGPQIALQLKLKLKLRLGLRLGLFMLLCSYTLDTHTRVGMVVGYVGVWGWAPNTKRRVDANWMGKRKRRRATREQQENITLKYHLWCYFLDTLFERNY